MSNFDFLKGFDDDLYKCGVRIEEQINKYPFGVYSEATAFLEHIVNNLRLSVGLKKSRKTFYDRLDEIYRDDSNIVDYKYKNRIYDAYQQRNKIHADLSDIEKDQYIIALDLHKRLYYISKKYFEIMGGKPDEFKGIQSYNKPELDFSPEELDLIEIPDFNEIVEFKYDYCVVCGKPNHSNYSIYCENCNNLIDNANNFISIRNTFGKEKTFTKEDLIQYGIHEGHVNSLITYLNKSDLFRVKGRLISFNNSKLDSFLSDIDYYIRVGELITQFREDKITPKDIKQTYEYKQGSFKLKPFYNFYKIINEEVINKFEFELISKEDIQTSVEFSTISKKELNRWYNIQLNQYKRNHFNEAFVIFNNLLIDDYLSFKRNGLSEEDIQTNLNITKEMIEFFPTFRENFESEITQIKRDLILQALSDNKSKAEAINFAGITPKEYDDIVKYSQHKKNEFSHEYQKIINERKTQILINLTDYDLSTTCKMSNINIDKFYEWYDDADITSEFYIKSTKILMNKYLDERKTGKTKSEVCRLINLKENIVDYWLKRKDKLYDEFQDKNLKVIVNLILESFKENKSRVQIAKDLEISVKKIKVFLDLGQRNHEMYLDLFTYYHEEVVPRNLSKFLVEIKNKTLKKALELADFTQDELYKYYLTDEDFHDEYLNIKMDNYIHEFLSGRNHKTSLKRSNLSDEEYVQLKDDIDAIILKEKMEIVEKEIRNDKTTEVAAKNAGVTFDDIYDWYYKGKSDEKFRKFSEFFYNHYIEPNILRLNDLLSKGHPIDKILKIFDVNFTNKDFEIWQKDGLITKEDIVFDLNRNKNDNEEATSILDNHTTNLYKSDGNIVKHVDNNSSMYDSLMDTEDEEVSLKEYISQKNPTKRSMILNKEDKDKLKKEIMGNKGDNDE